MNNTIEIWKNKTTLDYSQRDIFLSYVMGIIIIQKVVSEWVIID
jgi:hypothetical protein